LLLLSTNLSMQLLNLSTRTLKEEVGEDDSPPVLTKKESPPPLPPSPSCPCKTQSITSPLWCVISIYGWAWFRLLYAVYSREIEDTHCHSMLCVDDLSLIFVVVVGLSLVSAVMGIIRWNHSLIFPFLLTQSASIGGLTGAITYQSFAEFTSGSRISHIYSFCLLSFTVVFASMIGLYVTLKSIDNLRRTPIDKRKGHIQLFANPLFSPEIVHVQKEIARCETTPMDDSMSFNQYTTPPSLMAFFEDTREVPPIFDAYAQNLLA
ncbi:hypothetical protein PFISCL1PPCAC_20087, partial [Pristionchus fissidentatus]